jgi:protein SCO1/2
MNSRSIIFLVIICLLAGCQQKTDTLPVLGPKRVENGQKVIYPVPDFQFLDQDSQVISQDHCKDKIRVVDFFFISCPSICPQVQQQMLRIYNSFPEHQELIFLSHSIDVKRDTVGRLREYARQLGLDHTDRWHFLTGDKEQIFSIADDYFNIVVEDESAPGGFDHTGRIVVVDPQGYIRAYANGTNPLAVDTLIQAIQTLLHDLY